MKKTEKKDLNRIYQGDVTIRNVQQWENFRNKYDQINGSVTFPKEVNGSIYMNDCTGLTSVTFPKEVNGSISMNGCTGLTSVTFLEKSGSIYMNGCTGLTSVTTDKRTILSSTMQTGFQPMLLLHGITFILDLGDALSDDFLKRYF